MRRDEKRGIIRKVEVRTEDMTRDEKRGNGSKDVV